MNGYQLESQLADFLKEKLPQGIEVKDVEKQPRVGDKRADLRASFVINGKRITVLFEVKDFQRLASIREAARQVKIYAQEIDGVPFVAGRFFGDRARQVAKEEGVGLLDLAGNFYLNKGGLYFEKVVEKNPFSRRPELKSLFAPVSSRICRVMLCQPQKRWLIKDLAKDSDVSLGQTYNVTRKMLTDELVGKNEKKEIELLNPATLLKEWKKSYPDYKPTKSSFYMSGDSFEDRLSMLVKQSDEDGLFYALSFFSGAQVVAPFLRGITKIQFYVKSPEDIQKWRQFLELEEVEKGPNVEIYLPYDQGVFYQSQRLNYSELKDVRVVNNVQLYMDLFDLPGRGREQAEHLREVKLSY